MENEERTRLYWQKIRYAERILKEVTKNRSKSGILLIKSEKSLGDSWNVSERGVYNIVRDLEDPRYWAEMAQLDDKMPLKKKIIDRVPIASERMSDYLYYCGFSDEHARAIISSLSALNPNIEWQKPDERIKPYVQQQLEGRLK